MVRKYVRRLGAKFRRNYPFEAMENALQAVVERGLSFRQAADEYQVPKSSVYRKYRGLHRDTLGRPPALTSTEEKKIVDALIFTANYGIPFTKNDLRRFVQNYLNRKGVRLLTFVNNLPGKDWTKSFLLRNKQHLTIRLSENTKRCRAQINVDKVNEYFDNLEVTPAGVPPSIIVNYDETNLCDDPGQHRVFVQRGSKHSRRYLDASKSSTSVMFAIAANGSLLPPYIFYRAKYLYPEWILGGPPGAHYNRSKNGWFDGAIFSDWFFKIAVPYFNPLVHTIRLNGSYYLAIF
jgi:hypothetical protein